ncbi:MAG: ribbon-helix-helix domain-containing protein [Caulobacteraceae bacterium]|nr:ribbon-helix-helix domain-containing protein [Caulobacteraceae bacterium]
MSGLVKRSLMVAGHATSVALEPEFWTVLEAMAERRAVPLSALVAEIDAARAGRPLASACRVGALRFAQDGTGCEIPTSARHPGP